MNKATYHVVDSVGRLVRSTTSKEQAETMLALADYDGSIVKTVDHEIIFVDHIPNCDLCDQDGTKTPGPYDFKTVYGPWAHGCEAHWKLYRAYDSLGTGNGQLWIQRPKKA